METVVYIGLGIAFSIPAVIIAALARHSIRTWYERKF